MPSTQTITSFYSFVASTTNSPQVIKSAEVNNNFNIFRGHIIPVDPNTATAAPTRTYDLGADEYRWRYIYGKPRFGMISTTGSMSILDTYDVVFMDSTSATITATLFAVSANTGASFYLKNIGSANSVLADGSGTETIDNTLTVNLIPGEGAWFYCTGVQWRML